MAIKDTGERFKAHYDKLIAVVVMLALLGSLVYLAVQVGMMKKQQAAYATAIARKTPAHPEAQALSPSVYEKALAEIRRPHTITISTNRTLFVPEKRYYCYDCLNPVDFSVTNKCTWCGKGPQKPVKPRGPEDIDKDGMPNEWEKAHGLMPYDPSDAALDPDGDKFSNLQEFQGDTDPNDSKSFPPLIVLVEIVEIRDVLFRMLFQGKVTLPTGKLKYQVNYGGKSYFVRLNEAIGESGYVLPAYREKWKTVASESLSRDIKVDVSEIDLVKGDKTVTLVYQQPNERVEPRVTLRLDIDDLVFKDLEIGGEVKLRDGTYEVKAIDSREAAVVLTRTGDETKFTITKGGKKPAGDDEEK